MVIVPKMNFHYFLFSTIMNQHKQDLYDLICDGDYVSGANIQKNPNYSCKLDENDQLHSKFLESKGYYEPAIIQKRRGCTYLFWLFNGEIRDCVHPFVIAIDNETNTIKRIRYYSSERIQSQQPVCLSYINRNIICTHAYYNCDVYTPHKPLINDIYPSKCVIDPGENLNLDMSKFDPETYYPLWEYDFINCIQFKFED